MVRLLLFLLAMTLLAAGVIWLSDHDGQVVINWGGWRIESTTLVLVLAMTVVEIALYFLLRGFAGMLRLPRWWKARRQRRGGELMMQGFTALAAGDMRAAQKISKRSQALVQESPLALMLAAQTALMEGNEDAARQYFSAMTEHKESAFLGLRGLLVQAMRAQHYDHALELATRADDARPNTPWVLKVLVELYMRLGRYPDALKAVEKAVHKKALSKAESAHKKALVKYRQAVKLEDKGDHEAALGLLREAHKLDAEFSPAALLLAQLLANQDKRDKAAKVIESAWKALPQPQLALRYRELFDGLSPEKQLKRLDKLATLQPESYESNLMIARAALQAEDFAKARNHIKVALSKRETRAACRLMADIEKAEHGDGATAQKWMEKASTATQPAPAWSCQTCGHRSKDWELFCESCGSFDTMRWKESPSIAVVSHVTPGLLEA